jgi:hypothetical protein
LRPLGRRIVLDSGRQATIFPDDGLLVSYPRSGNTWLSFLLTNLIYPDAPTTFLNLESRCPDIYTHSDTYLTRQRRPRLLKSHEYFDPSYGRVVYLVRDPRDVALSYFRFLIKLRMIPESLSLDEFVDGFVEGRWDSFGTWGEHVGSWTGARGQRDSFLLVRFEDLVSDPLGRLASIASFLGVSAGEDDCERAVALSELPRMRQLEVAESHRVPELRDTRQDIPFIGAAEVGRGRVELSETQQRSLTVRWGSSMHTLGYLAEVGPSAVPGGTQ